MTRQEQGRLRTLAYRANTPQEVQRQHLAKARATRWILEDLGNPDAKPSPSPLSLPYVVRGLNGRSVRT
jgi:hypothetical protein